MNAPDPAKVLFSQLLEFLQPVAAASGLTLRPFSAQTLVAIQLAGLTVGTPAWQEASKDLAADAQAKVKEDHLRQLYALLVIQTCDGRELKNALRKANGDFEGFYWDFVFEKLPSISVDGLAAIGEQLQDTLPVVAASQLEVQRSESTPSPEKAPPNT